MSGEGKGDWNPGAKYEAYLRAIRDILSNGEQRTVRDVYYALEATGFPEQLREESYARQAERHHENPDEHEHPDVLPEEEWSWDFEYRYVKRAVKRGRRARLIDPGQIIDASRDAENFAVSGYESPQEFVDEEVDGIWNGYWENYWDEQETYVEVWLEKQSLASVFAPICEEYNVRLEATRGDWSDSKVYEAAQRLTPYIDEGRDVRILYFGDYNPSGYHAPVSILDTLGYYGLVLDRPYPSHDSAWYYDVEGNRPFGFGEDQGTFQVERLALTTEQIGEFDLPENPVPSSTDKDATIKESFQRFVSEGRDTNVELNALKEYHRDYLEDLVRDGIEEYIDEEAKEEVEKRIIEQRAMLEDRIEVDI